MNELGLIAEETHKVQEFTANGPFLENVFFPSIPIYHLG